MSTSTVSESKRNAAYPSNEAIYRPISALAVIVLLVSFLCGAAFANPMIWILPAVNLLLAIWVSRNLEAAKNEYAGQVLAKLAILITLIFGIGAPTKYFVEKYVIESEARAIANEYLDNLLAGDIKRAFVFTLSPLQRVGQEDSPDQLITRAGQNYREFLQQQIVIDLRRKLADAQVTYKGTKGYLYFQGMYHVALEYVVTMDDGAIYDLRALAKGGSGDWSGRKWYIEGADFNLRR